MMFFFIFFAKTQPTFAEGNIRLFFYYLFFNKQPSACYKRVEG